MRQYRFTIDILANIGTDIRNAFQRLSKNEYLMQHRLHVRLHYKLSYR